LWRGDGDAGDREDGDVVVLAEGFGGGGDNGCGLRADGTGAFEAVELAGGVRGFDDPVGDQGKGTAGCEVEVNFCVVDV